MVAEPRNVDFINYRRKEKKTPRIRFDIGWEVFFYVRLCDEMVKRLYNEGIKGKN